MVILITQAKIIANPAYVAYVIVMSVNDFATSYIFFVVGGCAWYGWGRWGLHLSKHNHNHINHIFTKQSHSNH